MKALRCILSRLLTNQNHEDFLLLRNLSSWISVTLNSLINYNDLKRQYEDFKKEVSTNGDIFGQIFSLTNRDMVVDDATRAILTLLASDIKSIFASL